MAKSMIMNFTKTIQDWFDKEFGGSLILPDGWYGRPYDNQHLLTFLNEKDNILFLVLDDKLKLQFRGLKSVRVYKHELIFGPFDNLQFEWESYGSDGQHGTKKYQKGEVKIVSTPG